MTIKPFFFLILLAQIFGSTKWSKTNEPMVESSDLKDVSIESELTKMSDKEKLELLFFLGDVEGDSGVNWLTQSTFGKVNSNVFDTVLLQNNYKSWPIHVLTKTPKSLPSNTQLASTDLPKLLQTKYFHSESIAIQNGCGFLVDSTLSSYELGSNFTLHSSPLNNERFWSKMTVPMVHSGFFSQENMDKFTPADFELFPMSGLRYLNKMPLSMVLLDNTVYTQIDSIPVPFSPKIIQDFIRTKQGFRGVLIAPDFSFLPQQDQIILSKKTLMAGADMLIVSGPTKLELVKQLLPLLKENEKLWNEKFKRILQLKYELAHRKHYSVQKELVPHVFQYQVTQASLICLKNNENRLPFKSLTRTFAYYKGEGQINPIVVENIQNYVDVEIVDKENKKTMHAQTWLVDGFNRDLRSISTSLTGVTAEICLLTDLQTIMRHRSMDFGRFDQIMLTVDTTDLGVSAAVQAAFGASDVTGRTPCFINPSFRENVGTDLKSLNRLQYLDPSALGINKDKLMGIDSIVNNGIKEGAFPGCQVQVAWQGKVFYRKNFGVIEYKGKEKVDNQTVYDLASITKIAGSTIGLMHLQGKNEFSLNKTLGDYLPSLTKGTAFSSVMIKDMMAHQAGFPAWIPFYSRTVSNGQLKSYLYSNKKEGVFTIPVAKDIWLNEGYPDTIYSRILAQNLGEKKYLYSDLGYYFVKKIIEGKSGEALNEYLSKNIYHPLGLRTMLYNPYLTMDLSRIAPTEKDVAFRQQTIRGYVHDPGAAMLGGVGGHAGLFSTANDLCILMQMCLNGGKYGGVQVLNPAVIKEYTSVQFPDKNRRGAGFDKPTLNKVGGTACPEVSSESYGHSGFTGTLTWADPTYGINYVFLSNRVNPDAENWKIVKMDIRTNIQTVIYKSIKSMNYTNYLL